jgi:hypothetical protein
MGLKSCDKESAEAINQIVDLRMAISKARRKNCGNRGNSGK